MDSTYAGELWLKVNRQGGFFMDSTYAGELWLKVNRHFVLKILCGVLSLKCCRFRSHIKPFDKCFLCLTRWKVLLGHVLLFHCS